MSRYAKLAGLAGADSTKQPPEYKEVATSPLPTHGSNDVATGASNQPPTATLNVALNMRLLLRLLVQDNNKSSNYRMSSSEKASFDDAVYEIKRLGFTRTNANECIRIAIDAIVTDFNERGEESLVCQVLRAKYPSYTDE